MSLPSYNIEVKEHGRVNLPAELRAQLNLKAGDRVLVRISGEGRAELVTASVAVKQTRGLYAHLRGESSPVEELIAERRAEV